jgi:hypothetical protein
VHTSHSASCVRSTQAQRSKEMGGSKRYPHGDGIESRKEHREGEGVGEGGEGEEGREERGRERGEKVHY